MAKKGMDSIELEGLDVFADFYKDVEGESFKELVEGSSPVGRRNEEGLAPFEIDEEGMSTKEALSKAFTEYNAIVGAIPISAKQENFLRAFVKCKNLTKAFTIAGCTRSDYNNWMKSETGFADAVRGVVDFVADMLEDTALELALGGNEKLLIKMLEAYRPEKFSPKRAVDIKSEHTLNINSWSELARKAMEAEKQEVIEGEILGEDDEDGDIREVSDGSKI